MLVLLFLFFRAVQASLIPHGNSTEQFTFSEITPSTTLIWYPCNMTFFCAMLDVPLDYSKPNGTRAAVPLIMIAAESNSTDYQGMLLTNPGGPGDTGTSFLLTSGFSSLKPVVGPNYDIVSFDPRGIGFSVPLADCQIPSEISSNLRRRAFGLSGPELTKEDYWNSTFAAAQELGAACGATIGGDNDAGPHMSSTVVARDMLSIVDAFSLTEKGQAVSSSSLVNYWGFSYGTIIGHIFASMFPDRVGRFAMDAVADPVDYVSGQELDSIELDDAITSTFFTYCHLAGPSLCPFFTGSTPADIHLRFQNIFDQLNAPFALSQNWTNATVIDMALSIVKSATMQTLYDPIDLFPQLASQLIGYETALKNLTVDGITAASMIGDVPTNGTQLEEWPAAILCSDIPSIFNQTFEDLQAHIQTLENQTFISGEIGASNLVLCTGWPLLATSRYAGPFGAVTKNPVLFISNTFDPVTPIKNSQKWVPQYEGAQLLTIEAIGHTSLLVKNSCANSKIGAFFQNGELPGNDALCQTEAGPFGITVANLTSITTAPNSTSSQSRTVPSTGAAIRVRSSFCWYSILILGIAVLNVL